MPDFALIDISEVPPETHTNGGHIWTEADVELVRQLYGKIPVKLLARKTGVGEKALYQKAREEGVAHRRLRNCHQWTPEEDGIVRRSYDGTRDSAQRIALHLGLSFFQVKGRVQRLGLARVTHRAWTPAEDARLGELIGRGKSQIAISKILKRSPNAVKIRMNRHLRLHCRDRIGWYTASDAAEILGVDSHWVINRIKNGSLEAKPHYPEDTPQGPGLHPWEIREQDLRAFIIKHCHELTGRNLDVVAVVDLLVGLEN
jgi:hypothetical protein